MKRNKFAVYILLTIMIINLSGCGGTKSQNEDKNSQYNTSVSADTSKDSDKESAKQTVSENKESNEDKESVSENFPSVSNSDAENINTEDKNKDAVKVKGIYVTGPMAGSMGMEDLIKLVEETDLNTMVIDVKNDDGQITYNMDQETVQVYGATCDYIKDINTLMAKLHDKNIHVIGRIVCFKDPILAKNNTACSLTKASGGAVTDGNGIAWVNPYKEEVWDYLCQIAEKAIEDGFDEIQFDYVRFPIGKDTQNANYGVDTSEYTRVMGITNFFEYVSERLGKKNISWGADLFGTVIGSEADMKSTGQDYVTISTLCDNVCPMIYPSHYANGSFGISVPDAQPYKTIYGALTKSKEVLSNNLSVKAKVRPWLQCFTASWVDGHISYKSKEVAQQIEAVYDAGYDEFILWNAQNRYNQVSDALKEVSSYLEDNKEDETVSGNI